MIGRLQRRRPNASEFGDEVAAHPAAGGASPGSPAGPPPEMAASPEPRAGARRSARKNRLSEIFEDTPTSQEDAFSEAADDLRVATAPALELLVTSVPGSRTPEEAMSTLDRQQASLDVLPPGPTPGPDHNPPGELIEAVVRYRVRHHMTSYHRPVGPAKGRGAGEKLLGSWTGQVPDALLPESERARPAWSPAWMMSAPATERPKSSWREEPVPVPRTRSEIPAHTPVDPRD